MKPTILPTLYASIYHLSVETRKIENLREVMNETGAFAVGGEKDCIHISMEKQMELSEDMPIPIDLRMLMEFAKTHDVYEIMLTEDEEPIPCLPTYDDDYVFSMSVYAKIEMVKEDGSREIHTTAMEIEPTLFADQGILETFRETCSNYAMKNLDANACMTTFITKAEYDKLNASEDMKSTLTVDISDPETHKVTVSDFKKKE